MIELHSAGQNLEAAHRQMAPRCIRLKAVLLQILLEAESHGFRTTTGRIHDASVKELAIRTRIASLNAQQSAAISELLLDLNTEILFGIREMIDSAIEDDWLATRLLLSLPGYLPYEA